MPPRKQKTPKVAFVLGGGGHLGAHEVGMLRALIECDVIPDLVIGTSVGALNGAAIAASPTQQMVDGLETVWLNLDKSEVFGSSFLARAANLAKTRTHLHSNRSLRSLIERFLPPRIEDLELPFQCVAASIERAAEHWFDSGPLSDAILASSAVPGLLPVVEIDGEHFVDGGIVNSIPIARAVHLGATEIYVLHVGRLDRQLAPPRNLWQVAWVAFEIARRHRFAHDMASLPEGVVAHLMPTGEREPPRFDSVSQLRYRDFSTVKDRISRAHQAGLEYLKGL